MQKALNTKLFIIIMISFLLIGKVYSDIAPNPIIVKGIYTLDSCKIQMTHEYVYADLYNDSAKVECTFELLNYGDSITIQIGFPVMNFQYFSWFEYYNESDKANFKIYVDDRILTENEIGVPSELDSIYNVYMYVWDIEKELRRKTDSIYKANNVIVKENGAYEYQSTKSYQLTSAAMDELYNWRKTKPYIGSDLWEEFNDQMEKGNFPWYVWNVRFDKNEKKTIKVIYSLPSGQEYSSHNRYFKYILETGSGWHGKINQAVIELKLHDIKTESIEEISPKGYQVDKVKKTINWNFINLEPTKDDDIYVRYYHSAERKN